jgi:polyhydroxyalkanoate synthase
MVNPQAPAPDYASIVTTEVERTIERARRSVSFLLDRSEPNVGQTPKDLIYSQGTLNLYRYRPTTDEVYRVPVLLVMSLVSKAYIFDLTPGLSMVEFLLNQGFDVFMIDWGEPRPEDHDLNMDSYALDLIPACVEQVQQATGEQDVTVVGYCMGGLLSLLYGGTHPDAPMKNLICIASPVDMEGMGLFRQWCDPRWFDVDRIVDTLGNVPPEIMYRSFEMLRPTQRMFAYIRLWDNMWNDQYVESYRIFDKWTVEQVPFPGEAFRQMTKELLWENKLMKGELRLRGQLVDTKQITCPVLNATAEHDHIAPYAATAPLTSLVGSAEREDIVLKGGHVSLVAGKSAVLRLWPKLSQWLSVRST